MSDAGLEELERRVLVLAPTARDAATSRDLLAHAGMRCVVCPTIADVCREAARGVGMALVTAEAVVGDTDGRLAALLRAQPHWSDLPLIVLTPPGPDSPRLLRALDAVGLMTLMKRPVQVSTLVSAVRAALRDRERQYAVRGFLVDRERYRVTLASIGDAVIATDGGGAVTFLNPVAEALTGWRGVEAAGRPLTEVFPIVNETTRREVENPALRALREGVVVGLANHTVLLARDGTERPIDDSAAPIRDAGGETGGAVLVFRDITERKQAEGERARLAAIVESSDDAIISKTLDGVIRSWNAGAERLFGYAAADAVGRPITLIIPPERRDEERDIIERLRRGERIDHFETVRVARDGRRLDISLSVSPLRDAEGHVVGASKVARDVTAQKRSEEELRRREREMSDFFENASVGLHWVGPDGTILRANRAELDLLGYTREEYVGRNIAEFHADRAEIDDILERLVAGETLRNREARMVRGDGTLRHVLIDSSVLREDGRFVHTRCFTRDVTDRVRAEADLREARTQLQAALDAGAISTWTWDIPGDRLHGDGNMDRLFSVETTPGGLPVADYARAIHPDDWPRVSAAIAHAVEGGGEYESDYRVVGAGGLVRWVAARGRVERDGAGRAARMSGVILDITERKTLEGELRVRSDLLTEADRRKDDFIALLAHELRNPLAPIRNGLQVIRLSDDRATRQRSQEMMDRQLAHMVRIIDDLLDVSRINRNKMELRRGRVRLADVVGSAVETVRPLIDAGGHRLEVSLPPEPVLLDCDLTRLSQVFGNLLSNSAKYTPAGGRIWLAAERRGGEVAVTVRDTGIGIPADALPTVFDMFSQVDRSIEKATGGLGIGLALVKGLVEMHGGTVTARSEGQDRGSEFVVTLPTLAEASEIAMEGSGDAAPGPGMKRRVLVVDDNRDGAESLATMLELLGSEVAMAHDGLEAVDQADRFRPEVILMDIGMPRMNGLEATQRIRAKDWAQGIAIIALTGWGQDGDRERSREAGCNGHLVKPVNLPDLQKVLEQVHGLKRG